MKLEKYLKKQGYRVTKPRQEILNVLASHPVTAQEIYDTLQKKYIHVDLVSIYRSLELFTKLKLVHVIEFGENKKRYELADENNHHHHLVCNDCGNVEDITLDENKFTKELKINSQFKIDHHHLEFFGLCANCQ